METLIIDHLEDDNFDNEILNSKGLVLVDFWAKWCGPCHGMIPILEACASEYKGRVRIVKVDVDENPRTAERYEIRTIPTLIFFREGKPIEVIHGAPSFAVLKSTLERLLTLDTQL